MALGFSLVTLLGMEGNQCSLMFFWPQLSVFMQAPFHGMCYDYLCSPCFVEIDTFPKLYCMFGSLPGLAVRPDN